MSPGRPVRDEEIIRIEHLNKIFEGSKPVTAVSDMTFSVKKGEIFGLLGPNGAGKSTLIRILTTLLVPSSGTAFVGSFDVRRDPEEIRKIIGVCPQNGTLDTELTAYENLDFYGKLQNMRDPLLKDRIRQLLDMAGLADRAHAQVSTFSGGMKRKLEIVRAFLHQPEILFLDEPTIGLDPDSRRQVWQQIGLLNHEDTTVILTTHYMDEAEKLCQRIAFVNNGRLIALDSPDNLKRAMPTGDLIEIGTESGNLDSLVESVRTIPDVFHVEQAGFMIKISSHTGSQILPALLSNFERKGIKILTIMIRTPSLEDVFIHLTGATLQGGDQHDQKTRRRA